MTRRELKASFLINNKVMVCAWCEAIHDKQNHWKKSNMQDWKYLNFGLDYVICPNCFGD